MLVVTARGLATMMSTPVTKENIAGVRSQTTVTSSPRAIPLVVTCPWATKPFVDVAIKKLIPVDTVERLAPYLPTVLARMNTAFPFSAISAIALRCKTKKLLPLARIKFVALKKQPTLRTLKQPRR
jgi:hypothetical protein